MIENKVKEKTKFFGTRLLSVLIIVIGLTFIAFCLSYLCPSDPVELQIESMGMVPTEELVSATKESLGLNRPFIVQYFSWLWNFICGDMGNSLLTGKPVFQEIMLYLPNTLILTLTSMVTTMIFSIILGVICAVNVNSVFDYAVRVITYFFASFPGFFLALLLLYIFSIRYNLFPVISTVDAKGMILPVSLLTFTMSAHYIRQIRAIVLEQLNRDYVTGCKARGIPAYVILFRHVLKNSLVPIITLMGISFGGLLGGSAIVENIFTWPGLGKYALSAIQKLDYPIIQSYVVWMALIYLAVNLLVDVFCVIVNPRVQNETEGSVV